MTNLPPGLSVAKSGRAAAGASGTPARLLAAVAEIAPVLQANAAASDEQGRLADESVRLLTANDLWKLRLCRELGGLELPITSQIELIAALAAEDAASAWVTMIANNAVAVIGATMPQPALDRVFADGVPICSIVAAPAGSAKPVPGGYLLTGTWRLAAGVAHADWVHAVTFIDRDPSRPLPVVLPAGDLDLLDSWRVVGLAGTGSNDFELKEYFLPAELAGREDSPYGQVRGARRYDVPGVELIDTFEHLAFAIGIARRALRELRQCLSSRAYGTPMADREMVQGELGEAVIRLQATEALAHVLYARIDAAASGDFDRWAEAYRHLPRGLAAWGTKVALGCVQLAFQRAGRIAITSPNIFEKMLRDMSVAATHIVVEDSAFPSYAQHLIETGASLELNIMPSNLGPSI